MGRRGTRNGCGSWSWSSSEIPQSSAELPQSSPELPRGPPELPQSSPELPYRGAECLRHRNYGGCFPRASIPLRWMFQTPELWRVFLEGSSYRCAVWDLDTVWMFFRELIIPLWSLRPEIFSQWNTGMKMIKLIDNFRRWGIEKCCTVCEGHSFSRVGFEKWKMRCWKVPYSRQRTLIFQRMLGEVEMSHWKRSMPTH